MELDICLHLKKNADEEVFAKFTSQIEQRNKTYFMLRSMAKCLYHLTDNKFLTSDKVKDTVINSIWEKTTILGLSQQLLDKFIQTQEISSEQTFAITEILEFIKLEGVKEDQVQLMMKWLRGIFKYLYYQKGMPELSFNRNELKLNCTHLITTNLSEVREYQSYFKQQCDDYVKVLGEFMEQNDQILAIIPELAGHKKTVVECNYVAEHLLRYLHRIPLAPFHRISSIIQAYQLAPDNVGEINTILSSIPHKSASLKKLFEF